MWEAVSHESKLAFLDILLDWVEKFLFRDLEGSTTTTTLLQETYLLLRVCPTRYLYYHVEDSLLNNVRTILKVSEDCPDGVDDDSYLFVRVKWDVVKRADGRAILLDVAAPVESVWLSDIANSILRWCFGISVSWHY